MPTMLCVEVPSWDAALAPFAESAPSCSALCAIAADDRASCSIPAAVLSTVAADFSAVAASSSTDAASSVTLLELAAAPLSSCLAFSDTSRELRAISSALAAVSSTAAAFAFISRDTLASDPDIEPIVSATRDTRSATAAASAERLVMPFAISSTVTLTSSMATELSCPRSLTSFSEAVVSVAVASSSSLDAARLSALLATPLIDRAASSSVAAFDSAEFASSAESFLTLAIEVAVSRNPTSVETSPSWTSATSEAMRCWPLATDSPVFAASSDA